MAEAKPSTLPLMASFDPANPLGFLEKVLDLIRNENKDTAEKEIASAVTTVKEMLKEKKQSLKPIEEESGEKMSKKAAKKEAIKREKLRRRQEQEEQEAALKTASVSLEDDEHSKNFGDVTFKEFQTADPKAGKWREAVEGKKLTDVSDLVEEIVDSEVRIRGRMHNNCFTSNHFGFIILRKSECTIQCVANESEDTKVGVNMIKFLRQLSSESLVEVIGVVSHPKKPLTGTTQRVCSLFSSNNFMFDFIVTSKTLLTRRWNCRLRFK